MEETAHTTEENTEAIAVQKAAKRAIQEHEMMILSVRDREVFVEALLNPPNPSDKLRSAAQRYKQKIGE